MRDFEQLIGAIEDVHQHLQASAANAVNQALTIRNWLIGHHIVEFEQGGRDRAGYGENLIGAIAEKLSHIQGVDRRSLFKFRQFYLTYPEISEAFPQPLLEPLEKVGTLSPLLGVGLELADSELVGKVGTLSTLLPKHLRVPSEKLLTKLSYSHLELLLNVEDPLKRTFYEIECIKCTWSVRELKRQINTLYFERSGLSERPDQLSEMVRQKTSPQEPRDIIKNIYALDFLGLSSRTIVEESDLEAALLDHLQAFIIELGNGFCFEARQKRILIGENYYFIDLVFYHRILKCHVLLELKLGAFEHGDIGQLNTYVNYYKLEVMQPGDNPPVGILMVAEKDQALVKFATAGMDENLFIQQYLIQLPSKAQLEEYIENELRKWHR